jgi:hypothetical protein
VCLLLLTWLYSLVVFLLGDNVECRVPIKLSSHVLDDVCLVFELETVGIIGLSIGLCHVHKALFGKDKGHCWVSGTRCCGRL